MKTHRPSLLAALSATLVACGSSDTMMSDYGRDMDRHVDALRSEMSMHSQEIATAADVDAVARVEASHRQRNDDHMVKMDTVMVDMMSCTDGRGKHFDHGDFSESMGDLGAECDRHRDAMHDATGLEIWRAEERRHQDAMKAHLDGMHGQIGKMMGMGSGYSCGHCSHCGM